MSCTPPPPLPRSFTPRALTPRQAAAAANPFAHTPSRSAALLSPRPLKLSPLLGPRHAPASSQEQLEPWESLPAALPGGSAMGGNAAEASNSRGSEGTTFSPVRAPKGLPPIAAVRPPPLDLAGGVPVAGPVVGEPCALEPAAAEPEDREGDEAVAAPLQAGTLFRWAPHQ